MQVQAALGTRYKVEGTIASGGMSTVVRAIDLKHDRIVAVKVLDDSVVGHDGVDRFLREIQMIARLQHPHIVPLFDSGTADGLVFYTMPFIEGETLRDHLRQRGALPVDEALSLARELCDALAYAHERGILHRDVKPENVLLANGHALLADFGIARAISAATLAPHTVTGVVVGTPAYMSPEQASGERELDARSDLYSLACVLYEMLSGSPPHTGANAQALLAERFRSAPKPLRTSRADVPERVDRAVVRALAPNPDDRFASVRVFSKELANTGSQPGVSIPESRTWWRAAVGAVVVIVVAIGGLMLRSRAGDAAQLDPTRFVVLPLMRTGTMTTDAWRGDDCSRLLYDALARWKGMRLVDEMRTRDAVAAVGGRLARLDDALRVARRLRAGRLVWGSVEETARGTELRLLIYDVSDPSAPPIAREITRVASGGDVASAIGSLADSLVLRAALDSVTPTVGSSRNLGAVRAYIDGQRALDAWQLDSAFQQFERAVALDSNYAEAMLWGAQVASWLTDARSERIPSLASAALTRGLSNQLQPRAKALLALARNDFAQACAEYDALLARDSSDFIGWYGKGECLSRDRAVVSDRASPSGWRFRTSRHAAVEAYRRALELVPSFQRAFGTAAIVRLERILLATPNGYIAGYQLAADSVAFAAFPGLDADTLTAVPWPLEQFVSGGQSFEPSSYQAALERSRGILLRLTARWATDVPSSLPAQEAFALALENVTRLDTVPGIPSAFQQLQRARALATTRASTLHLDLIALRLRLKLGRWNEARALADSILADADSAATADRIALVSVALLVGRPSVALRLGTRIADRDTLFTPRGAIAVPAALGVPAQALVAHAITGTSADSVRLHADRVRRGIQQFVNSRDARFFRQLLVEQVLTLAYPDAGAFPELSTANATDFMQAEAAHARGDRAALRAALARIDAGSAHVRPGDEGPQFVHLYAWLLRESGDTTAARTYVSRFVASLTASSRELLNAPTGAAGLVRLLMLHAEQSWQGGDRAEAQRAASAVLALWGACDPILAPRLLPLRRYGSP